MPIFCGMKLEEGEAERIEWPEDVVRFDLDNDVATPNQVPRRALAQLIWGFWGAEGNVQCVGGPGTLSPLP